MGIRREDELRREMAKGLRAAGIAPGDRVVVAFSGGADSLGLLALAVSHPLEVEAVHVDHGLRPSSEEEARRALGLARSLRVRGRVVRVAVEGRGGLEAAARRARYRALAEVAAGRPVLTAHTLDDQAETVLLRLARGAGLGGAIGIRPVATIAGARVVRPLLAVRRGALRSLLGRMGLEPVEDPSNRDLRFARNRLRAEVMPALQAVVPGATLALARFAELARADERYLARRAARAGQRWEREGAAVEDLLALPLALRRRVVRERITAVAGLVPAAARVAEVLALLPRGGELHLPGGVLVQVREGRFVAGSGPTGRGGRRPLPPSSSPGAPAPAEELAPGRPLRRQGWRIEAEEAFAPASSSDRSELWTDVPPPWLVREVRRGERLPIPGTGHRLASDLLSEAKVPREERPRALVVEAGGAPLWLVGVRPLCRRPAEGARAWRLRALREPGGRPGADRWNEPAPSPVGTRQRREGRR